MSQLDGTPVVIGFDTSNYRTSVAAVTLDGEILVNHRELLPVSSGERGLRQSDAVFAHIRQLRNSEEALREKLKGTSETITLRFQLLEEPALGANGPERQFTEFRRHERWPVVDGILRPKRQKHSGSQQDDKNHFSHITGCQYC